MNLQHWSKITETKPDPMIHGNIALLTFEVNQRLYGFAMNKVRGILPLNEYIPLPDEVEMMEGVIDLEGKVVPVVDLRKQFNTERPPRNPDSPILITESQNFLFGITVDRVVDICNIPPSEYQAPPRINQPGLEFTLGIALVGGRVLHFLDLNLLLDVASFTKDCYGRWF